MLDEAMYKRNKLVIKTKKRGVIIGIPHNVDEFDADPDRLGYFVMIAPHLGDTVFLDEIVGITDYAAEPRITFSRRKLKYVSGK
jgi:hypothetical protein